MTVWNTKRISCTEESLYFDSWLSDKQFRRFRRTPTTTNCVYSWLEHGVTVFAAEEVSFITPIKMHAVGHERPKCEELSFIYWEAKYLTINCGLQQILILSTELVKNLIVKVEETTKLLNRNEETHKTIQHKEIKNSFEEE